jgi:hypothetical protein
VASGVKLRICPKTRLINHGAQSCNKRVSSSQHGCGTVVLPKYRITQPPTLRRKRLSKNAGPMLPTAVIPRTAFPRDGYIHGSQKAAEAVMASKGRRMP